MKKLLLAGLVVIVLLISVGCAASAEHTVNQSFLGLDSNGATGSGTSKGGTMYTYAAPTTAPRIVFPTPNMVIPNQPAPVINVTVPAASGYNSDSTVTYGPADQSTDRMVVRTGDMQIVVSQISVSMDSINQIASRYGGYVVSSQQWKEGDRNLGSISIRILAENYEKGMADLRTLAKSVTSESTNSQDVTQEYVDLNAQVKNLEATETQLLKIMESATKTEDILAIQQQLTNVRGQIEQIKARTLYLERTSSTSLINVSMQEAVLALKFNAEKVSAGIDETIKFTSEVIGGFAPYNYLWDFGDGNTSTEKDPSHAYKSAGTYSVGLKVTDDKGYNNVLSRSAYINIISSWKPGNTAHNAWNGFTSFGKGFVNFLIWAGIFSPVWIVIGLLIWYFVFHRRKKNRGF